MTSPARALALHALRRWRAGKEFADAVIQRLLLENALGDSDRKFAQELFYGVVRYRTLLDSYINQLRQTKTDPFSRDLLRLGLYQLFVLKVRQHAAIYETVELANKARRPLINAVLRSAVRHRDELEKAAATAPLSVRESHPEFLLTRWRKNFGHENTVALARWNNQPAPVYARVNTLCISLKEFGRKYPELRPLAVHPLFVTCETLPREAIGQGHCYIQDPSTTLAVELLQPKPADAILDACAAPGGKTAYIGALAENGARITACDRDAGRVQLLKHNLARLAVTNVTVLQHQWSAGRRGSNQFDKILLDAPCTNTGVMRRRIDLRWRLRPGDFACMRERQLMIARSVIPMLKRGGVFVYSTCSLEPEENEGVTEQLAREFPHLTLEKTESMLPFRYGFDGAFAARFVS